jgi:hypothetical protein
VYLEDARPGSGVSFVDDVEAILLVASEHPKSPVLRVTTSRTSSHGTPSSYHRGSIWRIERSEVRDRTIREGLGHDPQDGIICTMEARRMRRRDDHRFREVVRETGDIELAVRNGVPRSTARDWSRLASPKVISLDVASMSEEKLRKEVIELRERNARLLAILRLVVVLLNVCELSLRHRRVPEREKKRQIIRAVDHSKGVLSFLSALRVIGLSRTRYHEWKREEECELDDVSSCPQSHPQQLTAEERTIVRDMATSVDYRHVPTGTLSILAQRLGKVFASASTWHRLVRKNGWRRPRK